MNTELLTKDIVIPLISGLAPTLLLGLGWLIKSRFDRKEKLLAVAKEKAREEAEQARYIKSCLDLRLANLREAFLMEKNDLDSRIDAWKTYQKLGGDNYVSYIDELLAKKGLKSGEGFV